MIELKHLRTLQMLRQAGSLAAAATLLHQTQSALSHQLGDLEQRLGYRLFILKSQPLLFTHQGKILLELADKFLPQIQQTLQACLTPHQSSLRIAIECHSCIQRLTPALEKFRHTWPDVSVDFKSGVTFDPQPGLQQGSLDLVITSDILPRSDLYYRALFDYEVRLVIAPAHPLASKSHIVAADLADETLLIYPVQRQRMDIWRHFLQPAGIAPILKSVDNTQMLIQMVAAHMGVAALPHWAVDTVEKLQLVVTRPLATGLWSRLYAAVRNGEQQQPVIEDFIALMQKHVGEHLPFAHRVAHSSDNAPIVPTESKAFPI